MGKLNSQRQSVEGAYRDINKLHKRKTPAGHCDLVFYQNNSFHAFRAFFTEPSGILHCLRNSLRTRKRVQSSEQQHGYLGVTNIPCAVVRVLWTTSLITRTGTLRVINLDSSAVMRGTVLEGFVKCCRSGGTMRGRRRNLNERVEWVDKRARVVNT